MKKVLSMLCAGLILITAITGCKSNVVTNTESDNMSFEIASQVEMPEVKMAGDKFLITADNFKKIYNMLVSKAEKYKTETITDYNGISGEKFTTKEFKFNDKIKLILLCDTETEFIKSVNLEMNLKNTEHGATDCTDYILNTLNVFGDGAEYEDLFITLKMLYKENMEPIRVSNQKKTIMYQYSVESDIGTLLMIPISKE